VQVYAGDDHDYCEVEHREDSGKVKEITVKSISWAMGIRKPGFQMTSLWNPIDAKGNPISRVRGSSLPTIQNQLCLLPDQLSIFIYYALLLVFTLVVLRIRAAMIVPRSDSSYPQGIYKEPLLPTSVSKFLMPNDSHSFSAEKEKSQRPIQPFTRPLPSRS